LHNNIPVIRVPVGFKEIAAVERTVEETMKRNPGRTFTIKNELGEEITLGPLPPKLHHAGEESGGKIGGPRVPIYNILDEFVIAMREKSSGEAAFSAICLQSRLFAESIKSKSPSSLYLHNYLREIFLRNAIQNPMEFRGDIVHYNEAIIDPAELARAKAEGIAQRNVFNDFFRSIARACTTGETAVGGKAIGIEQVRDLMASFLPAMKDEWLHLERIDLWSDGLQMWFEKGRKVRDICLRASGTDAKTKVYFDGSDKLFLQKLYKENFENFSPTLTDEYKKLIRT
jgi:hypothetical protein